VAAFIGRREFITLLGGAAAGWPIAALAQQPTMPVIGSVYGVAEAEWAEPMTGFRRGLSESGFVEGRDVAIEYRWADGQFDRMPAMAADLVSRKVAVILVGGNLDGVRAAMAATQTIPIVFTTASDPVATGLVASLNRPSSNATGVTVFAGELGPKRLELLHELLPTAKKIALLVNPKVPRVLQDDIKAAQTAARRFGLEIIVVEGGREDEIESAFATAAQQRASALQVGDDAFLDSRRAQIAALGLRHALPTVALTRRAVAAGSLMSYGSNQMDVYRQAGIYVGRILKGEKPANLPVLQPTKFELAINLKTAKALGVEIPAMLLARADEIIE
jgi:putative ABC transport system substrate-binding protein